MRYRSTRSWKQRHAQVLTPPRLAALLVNLTRGTGGEWLELGSGTGRIADACFEHKKPDRFVGVELDHRLTAQAAPATRSELVAGDVLNPQGLDSLLGPVWFDRVVGNPPYGMAMVSSTARARLAALCPALPQVKGWVQLDLYFVLESLARLRRPGEAAFIVGAPIAEDARLMAFRRALLESASEVECYELPASIFERKAEVQSYLLIARFGQSNIRRVTVGRVAGEGLAITETRGISCEAAAVRMDLSFHEFADLDAALRRQPGCKTLHEIGASIVRGSRTRDQFHELGIEHFHTSDFPRHSLEVLFSNDRDHGFQAARSGDILLPRVGSRCLDRQALVTKGFRHYTEAVYRLRVPAAERERVIGWISSGVGADWRRGAAKGSCAKHVTVASLMGMPLPPNPASR